MSAKFDEEAHNGSVSIVFTRSKRDGHTHGHTDGTTAALLYPLRNALRGDNIPSATRCAGITNHEHSKDEGIIFVDNVQRKVRT